jgi:hypothetical protein
MMTPKPDRILRCYGEYQTLYGTVKGIEFQQGLPDLDNLNPREKHSYRRLGIGCSSINPAVNKYNVESMMKGRFYIQIIGRIQSVTSVYRLPVTDV